MDIIYFEWQTFNLKLPMSYFQVRIFSSVREDACSLVTSWYVSLNRNSGLWFQMGTRITKLVKSVDPPYSRVIVGSYSVLRDAEITLPLVEYPRAHRLGFADWISKNPNSGVRFRFLVSQFEEVVGVSVSCVSASCLTPYSSPPPQWPVFPHSTPRDISEWCTRSRGMLFYVNPCSLPPCQWILGSFVFHLFCSTLVVQCIALVHLGRPAIVFWNCYREHREGEWERESWWARDGSAVRTYGMRRSVLVERFVTTFTEHVITFTCVLSPPLFPTTPPLRS